MSRYDGLIIPRSYNEYINKSDPLTLAQALQQNNVLSEAVAAGDNKGVTSNAVNGAVANYINDKYCKNITPNNSFVREINFPLRSTNWFCGEVLGNLNNYGNICFYISVQSATSITKTNIIGDSTKINITIDETNMLLKMSCDNNYSINSITFIHS